MTGQAIFRPQSPLCYMVSWNRTLKLFDIPGGQTSGPTELFLPMRVASMAHLGPSVQRVIGGKTDIFSMDKLGCSMRTDHVKERSLSLRDPWWWWVAHLPSWGFIRRQRSVFLLLLHFQILLRGPPGETSPAAASENLCPNKEQS